MRTNDEQMLAELGGMGLLGLPPYVGIHHPDRVEMAADATEQMRGACRYCGDRDAHLIGGKWFHVVGRGGDAGQYEVCKAQRLRTTV